MSEDWLDIRDPEQDNAVAEEYQPRAGLPAVVAVPDDYASRLALVETCWARLSERQKLFLSAWRDCRYNARAAARQLGQGVPGSGGHFGWMQESDYATVVQIWRANAAASALDKDRLLARHDSIVEEALTPKPILHQGAPTGFEEVDVGAARSANADLMQAAGILKSGKDVEVNVGVAVQVGPPTLNIQVLPLPPSKTKVREDVIIDAKFTEVPSDEWLDA